MRTAVLLGANGLVGGALLESLAEQPTYDKISAFVRRPLSPRSTSSAKVQVVVVDFDEPGSYRDHLAVDDVFCCLGTTIKQAGSQAAFRRVDFEIPLAVAKQSLAAGAKRYLIVTAVGADAASSIFYNRVKGELEQELRALPFPDGVKIFHPSLLLGERAEPRAGETLATLVMAAVKPLLIGKWQRYRAITAREVASAMANVARSRDKTLKVYEGAELFAAARARAEQAP
jgi:uncharacterized protein YbjT (DUF2867 family)